MRVAKSLPVYSRGIITAGEFADALLGDIVDDAGIFTYLTQLVEDLPQEVQEQLREKLRIIKRADYYWRQFLIGGTPPPADPAILKRICEELGID